MVLPGYSRPNEIRYDRLNGNTFFIHFDVFFLFPLVVVVVVIVGVVVVAAAAVVVLFCSSFFFSLVIDCFNPIHIFIFFLLLLYTLFTKMVNEQKKHTQLNKHFNF